MTLEEIRQCALHLATTHAGYEPPESVAARARVYADFISNGIVPPTQPQTPQQPLYAYRALGGFVGQSPAQQPNCATTQGQHIWDAVQNAARR